MLLLSLFGCTPDNPDEQSAWFGVWRTVPADLIAPWGAEGDGCFVFVSDPPEVYVVDELPGFWGPWRWEFDGDGWLLEDYLHVEADRLTAAVWELRASYGLTSELWLSEPCTLETAQW